MAGLVRRFIQIGHVVASCGSFNPLGDGLGGGGGGGGGSACCAPSFSSADVYHHSSSCTHTRLRIKCMPDAHAQGVPHGAKSPELFVHSNPSNNMT